LYERDYREYGYARFVQWYGSVPVPNEEVVGSDLPT
jgi:hypothetical protein